MNYWYNLFYLRILFKYLWVFFFKFVLVCMFSHFLWKFSLFHVTFLFLLETVHYPKTERKIMSMSNICTFMPRLSYLLRDFFSWCIQLIRCCVNIYLYQIINLLKNFPIVYEITLMEIVIPKEVLKNKIES